MVHSWGEMHVLDPDEVAELMAVVDAETVRRQAYPARLAVQPIAEDAHAAKRARAEDGGARVTSVPGAATFHKREADVPDERLAEVLDALQAQEGLPPASRLTLEDVRRYNPAMLGQLVEQVRRRDAEESERRRLREDEALDRRPAPGDLVVNLTYRHLATCVRMRR